MTYQYISLHEQYEQDVLCRREEPISYLSERYGRIVFFHPNSAMFRVKRLMRGEHDPFVQATQLERMTVLDCTLGMASDSIVASYVVGESGKVTGLEGNEYMAYIMENGLKTWSSSVSEIDEAMQNSSKANGAFFILAQCEDNSYDVVYFDPMFEETVIESDGIKGLKHFALYHDITDETIAEAKRVARKRVVLKMFS